MTRAEMFKELKSIMVEVVDDIKDASKIHESDDLRDLGVDSIDMVEIVSTAMKRFNIRLDRTKLADANDIKGLLDLFEAAAIAAPQ